MFANVVDCLKYFQDHQIKFINCFFTIVDGSLQFEHFLVQNLTPKDLRDGIKSFSQENILFKPDLQSAFHNPFCSQGTFIFFCDLMDFDSNQPHELCVRSILQKTQDTLIQKFDSFKSYITIDFEIIDNQKDQKGNFFEEIPLEIMETSQTSGLQIQSCFPKDSTQHSIVLQFNNLLDFADGIIKVKFLIQKIVNSYGELSNFDIKRKWQSCLQTTFQLIKDGKNYFDNEIFPNDGFELMQKIYTNSELLSLFALGKEKNTQFARNDFLLEKNFGEYFLNFNYFNLDCNIYLALLVFCESIMQETNSEFITNQKNPFDNIDFESLVKKYKDNELKKDYISEKLLDEYIQKLEKKLQYEC